MTVSRAVGYARISKDDTLEGRGVGRQTDDITDVCARNGWDLVDVLVDNDVSASRYSTKARPGYQRLVELIASGEIDRAVIYDVDRLLRQPRQLEDLIDLCESRNGTFELHNVHGELDLRTGSGRFVARVLVSKAAMESDDLSRRLRRAFDQKAAEGRPHGARAFAYEPDGVTVRESEAVLLRQAAADVLAGVSLAAIARRWNDMGVLTPQRSRPWGSTVVKAVLTNPRHAGLRVHRGEVIGPAVWPAVLDRDVHERLVAVLTSRPKAGPRRRRAFTGLVVAPNGLPLDRGKVGDRPVYRGVRRPERPADLVSISAEPLERMVLNAVFEVVERGQLAELAGEQQARREAPPDIASIEEDLRLLAADFGRGRVSRAEWLAARRPLEDRLADARQQIPTDVDVDLGNLRERWDGMDVDAQRAVLRRLIDRIVVQPARKLGPQPMQPGVGRIDPDRVQIIWAE